MEMRVHVTESHAVTVHRRTAVGVLEHCGRERDWLKEHSALAATAVTGQVLTDLKAVDSGFSDHLPHYFLKLGSREGQCDAK